MLMKFYIEKKFQKLKFFVERLINFFQQVFKSINLITLFGTFYTYFKFSLVFLFEILLLDGKLSRQRNKGIFTFPVR